VDDPSLLNTWLGISLGAWQVMSRDLIDGALLCDGVILSSSRSVTWTLEVLLPAALI